MLSTHEMKTTHKFNGRKGVEDEVLKFPLRIMQNNIGNERLDLVPRKNWGPNP